MAENVFGDGEKKKTGEGVFADTSKSVADEGVFTGATSKGSVEVEKDAPVAPKVAETTGEMTAFGTGGVIPAKKPLPWKRILQIAIPVLAVLLLGGGVLAYVLVQNSDDKIVGDALTNMLKDNDSRIKGDVTVSNLNSDGDKIGIKLDLTVRADEEGKNGELSADVRVRPTISSVEALDGSKEFGGTLNVAYVNENIFAKMDYLQVLEQVVSAVVPDGEAPEWPEEVTEYNNRWLMVSNQTLTNFFDSENEDLQVCLQNQAKSLRGNNKAGREIYGILTTVVKFDRESKSDGIATYKVSPSEVLSDYYNFLVQVRDSKIVEGFVGCGDNYQEGFAEDFKEMLDNAIEDYEELSDSERENSQKALKETLVNFPSVKVQISTKTRRFTNVTINGSANGVDVDVKLDIESDLNKNVKIEAPSDYKELTESDLNGLDDLDLNGIMSSGQTTAQRNAVNRVIDQLAVYSAGNRNTLPTLSTTYDGRVKADDAFFTQYLDDEDKWDANFNLRLLNDDGNTGFPNSYSSMTDSGPFYLQDYTSGDYQVLRYSRYGDSNGDIWLVYGAACNSEGTLNTLVRSTGTSVAALTYLRDSSYYCADNK